MTRILHAIHDFLPRHQAGSEIYAFNLCRELAARHVVHVLAGEYDPQRTHGTLSWRVHEGLPIIELVNNWHAPAFADTWRSPRLGAQLDSVLEATQPDVLHLHSLLNLSFELPVLAHDASIRTITTIPTAPSFFIYVPSFESTITCLSRPSVSLSLAPRLLDPGPCTTTAAVSPTLRS